MKWKPPREENEEEVKEEKEKEITKETEIGNEEKKDGVKRKMDPISSSKALEKRNFKAAKITVSKKIEENMEQLCNYRR